MYQVYFWSFLYHILMSKHCKIQSIAYNIQTLSLLSRKNAQLWTWCPLKETLVHGYGNFGILLQWWWNTTSFFLSCKVSFTCNIMVPSGFVLVIIVVFGIFSKSYSHRWFYRLKIWSSGTGAVIARSSQPLVGLVVNTRRYLNFSDDIFNRQQSFLNFLL